MFLVILTRLADPWLNRVGSNALLTASVVTLVCLSLMTACTIPSVPLQLRLVLVTIGNRVMWLTCAVRLVNLSRATRVKLGVFSIRNEVIELLRTLILKFRLVVTCVDTGLNIEVARQ